VGINDRPADPAGQFFGVVFGPSATDFLQTPTFAIVIAISYVDAQGQLPDRYQRRHKAGQPMLPGLFRNLLVDQVRNQAGSKARTLLGRMSPRPNELECAYNRRPSSFPENCQNEVTADLEKQSCYGLHTCLRPSLLSHYLAQCCCCSRSGVG